MPQNGVEFSGEKSLTLAKPLNTVIEELENNDSMSDEGESSDTEEEEELPTQKSP